MLRERFGVSERRACAVAGQHRSTQRLAAPVRTVEEEQLREFLRAFSKDRPRWGWRRAAKAARPWRLGRQRQTHTAPVARRGPSSPTAQPQETADRYRHPRGGDVTHSTKRLVGARLPVRCYRRWENHQDAEHHRRVHQGVSRHQGGTNHRCR